MTMTTQRETWSALCGENVFDEHYDELSVHKAQGFPLDPRHDVYAELEAKNMLIVVTLREGSALAGYYVGVVNFALHYAGCLQCQTDIFRVLPAFRGRNGSVKLFRAVEAELRAMGVRSWVGSSKVHADTSRLFEALDFTPMETVHVKWL